MRVFILLYLTVSCSLISFGAIDSTALNVQQLIKSGQLDDALDILEPRLQHSPSFSDFYNAGVAYAEKKDYRRALGAFESALKIDPSNRKAQINAAFLNKKITPKEVWENPFSWTDRMIIAFRSFWIPAILAVSLILSVIVFLYVSKVSVRFSWMKKMWFPVLLVLSISLYALNRLHNHHRNHQLAVLQKSKPKVFISPDGVPVEGEIDLPLRLNIQDYSQDSSWVSINNNDERYWLKSEDLFIY